MGRRCELGSFRTVSPHTRPVGSRLRLPGSGRDESLSRRQQHSGRKALERGELPVCLDVSCAALQSHGQQRAQQQRRDQPCTIFLPQISSSRAGHACPCRADSVDVLAR
jgi:hypothetical protein